MCLPSGEYATEVTKHECPVSGHCGFKMIFSFHSPSFSLEQMQPLRQSCADDVHTCEREQDNSQDSEYPGEVTQKQCPSK